MLVSSLNSKLNKNYPSDVTNVSVHLNCSNSSKSHFVFGVETGDEAVDKEDLISDNGLVGSRQQSHLFFLRGPAAHLTIWPKKKTELHHGVCLHVFN